VSEGDEREAVAGGLVPRLPHTDDPRRTRLHQNKRYAVGGPLLAVFGPGVALAPDCRGTLQLPELTRVPRSPDGADRTAKGGSLTGEPPFDFGIELS
jgi:hypothetical protein